MLPSSTRALGPAILLILFAGWLGTFDGAASGSLAVASHWLLFALLAAAIPTWRPSRAPWLWLIGGAIIVVSAWRSPVSRAGYTALALLPAFLILPSMVERCWQAASDRRSGVRAISVVVALVATWSLVAWRYAETDGTSLPLGHHNLLAAWLVILLPLACLPWRFGGGDRILAAASGVLATASLAASRSLAGAVVWCVLLALMALLALLAWHHRRRDRRGRWLTLGGAMALITAAAAGVAAVVGWAGPRIQAILTSSDVSTLARQAYAQAALEGWLERPWLGWGPGSGRWLASEFLQPMPGVLPAGQIVADFHSLPLQLLFELGIAGTLAAALLVYGAVCGAWNLIGHRNSRVVGRTDGVDGDLALAARLGLIAGALFSFSGLPLAVPALPVALAVVFGANRSAQGAGNVVAGPAADIRLRRSQRQQRLQALALTLMAALLFSWQLPRDLAHLSYERAMVSDSSASRRAALRRAVDLDPGFPLYRFRLGLEAGPSPADLLRAAEDAGGLAPLWLAAGINQPEPQQAEQALLRACQLDPLSPSAPFRLALLEPALLEPALLEPALLDPVPLEPAMLQEAGQVHAKDWAARALFAEPRLAAATHWYSQPELLVAGLVQLRQLDSESPGWQAMSGVAKQFSEAPDKAKKVEETVQLALTADHSGATSLSLHAFRRKPWPVAIDQIELWAHGWPQLDFAPPILSLTSSSIRLDAQYCVLSAPSR